MTGSIDDAEYPVLSSGRSSCTTTGSKSSKRVPPAILKRNRQQEELKLQAKILEDLREQGFFATKTSDRFLAGRPDIRIGRSDLGQLDVELKFCNLTVSELAILGPECETGLTKLQKLKIEDMNQHGMPAVGLVYLSELSMFVVTSVLRESLLAATGRVLVKLPRPRWVDGAELFKLARNYNGRRSETRP